MSHRLNIEDLQALVRSRGLEPLFVEYSRNRQKLLIKCPKHGEFYSTAGLLKRGCGCRKCGRETYAKKRRGSIDKIRQSAKEVGLTLISEDFPQLHGPQNLLFECPIHGQFYCSHRKIMRGCPKCNMAKAANKRRKPQDVFKKEIENLGYELVSEYKGSSSKVTVKCPKHGEFSMNADGLLGGHGCQKCGRTYSGQQSEVDQFCKEFFGDLVKNDRKIISPKELDIFIPSLNLAIEYCGLYWHGESQKKDKNYHINKMKHCNDRGVRLITIFEDEWVNRKAQVKNFLLSVFGKNTTKIMARKTVLAEVTKKDADIFLNNNHIQGTAKFQVAYGLYYQGELVSIITGNRHHRQNHGHVFVLNRLAFAHGISVSGGASKLLKILINYAKTRGYTQLLSWSDNRWSNGKVYERLGFILEEELGPDYSYCKDQDRISKQACQKKHLVKKGATGNTEFEMAKSLGLSRIWDCGKKRWILYL